jgi:hypothetical protein
MHERGFSDSTRYYHQHPGKSGTKEEVVTETPAGLFAVLAAIMMVGFFVPIHDRNGPRARELQQKRDAAPATRKPVQAEDILPDEEYIAAFENPLTGKYERLPDGYDPPNSFALMHFMSQNQGRGAKTQSFNVVNPYTSAIASGDALRVRYVPRGETVPPLLVHDRATNKVIKYRESMEGDDKPAARPPARRGEIPDDPEENTNKKNSAPPGDGTKQVRPIRF